MESGKRIYLKNPSVLFDWIKSNATFLRHYKGTDYYFDPPGCSHIYAEPNSYEDSDKWLRIRMSDQGCSVSYRDINRDKQSNRILGADEIETSIEDASELKKIFLKIGFRLVATATNKRSEWEYEDFTFLCDNVDGIGLFVEIRFVHEGDNILQSQKMIDDLLKEIKALDFTDIKCNDHWMILNSDKCMIVARYQHNNQT